MVCIPLSFFLHVPQYSMIQNISPDTLQRILLLLITIVVTCKCIRNLENEITYNQSYELHF